MKIAIKVLTEWDRENVIAFFEKHYLKIPPVWEIDDVTIGSIFWLDNNEKSLFMDDGDEFATPSNYTILQGVPQDMELPKVETNPTREQELEDFVKNAETTLQTLYEYGNLKEVSGVIYGGASHRHYLDNAKKLVTKAKHLLNQK